MSRKAFHQKKWTPHEEERLRFMRANGEDVDAIARALGRSKRAVVRRAMKLGLPRARWIIPVANGEAELSFRELVNRSARLATQQAEIRHEQA